MARVWKEILDLPVSGGLHKPRIAIIPRASATSLASAAKHHMVSLA